MDMGLGLHLKGALPNVRTGSHTSREIKNATISEFSTFLKSSKSREQFLLRLTFFLPYLRLTVKIFQFLQLSSKFLAVLRLSVNPIETLLKVRGPALPGSFPGSFADPRDAMACTNSNMAAGSSSSSSNFDTSQQVDRIALLYPKVDESETPLPRSWSPKDKFTFIGLSQNNLKVHYKGRREIGAFFVFFEFLEP